jgi:hypothetical protein
MSLVAVGPLAEAATVALPAVQDATLYQSANGSLANGSGQYLFAGRTLQSSGFLRRSLLRFDIAAGVPTGSVITAASLTLHVSTTIDSTPRPISLHAVTRAWNEGPTNAPDPEGAGGSAVLGDVTWMHTERATSNWTNPGGDFVATASATQSVGGIGFYSWTGPGLVADVQRWLDDPAANFGWILIGNETTSPTARRFESRQSPSASFRPVLTLDWQPIPEPAVAAMALPALAWLARRRVRPRAPGSRGSR